MAHKNYKNINLLGTSHIARQSLNEVRASFSSLKPDIVTLELDKDRLRAVLSGKREKPGLKDILRIGIRSYLFAKFGAYVEEKLGSVVGVKPGSEMKLAYELAVQNKVRVVLIDQNIQITLKRLISGITLREKFRFVFDLIKGLIFRKQEISFDLSTVPSDKLIESMIEKVRYRYPNVYRVLIEERNLFMAKRLYYLMQANEDKVILAIVGAGHVDEMIGIIKRLEGN